MLSLLKEHLSLPGTGHVHLLNMKLTIQTPKTSKCQSEQEATAAVDSSYIWLVIFKQLSLFKRDHICDASAWSSVVLLGMTPGFLVLLILTFCANRIARPWPDECQN